MPWWHREKRDGFQDRIKAIQRINDPGTYSDEVLKGSKILLFLLLCFSGMLGALSYYKNFSISFPAEFSIAMALTLTFVIEWGKNRAATWAVRIPFFQGWRSLGYSPANTFIFAGLVAVSLATFCMSIYNSTKGGEQLAIMLSHERNHKDFTPDTRDVDAQISATQQGVTNAPMVKWKGKSYYQDARSVRAANKTIETLARQREDLIKSQRADYERNLAMQASQTGFASRLVLASGGWIELLQILLIVLRVACERNLDSRSSTTPSAAYYQQNGTGAIANSRPIGFNLTDDGNVRNANIQYTVTQPPLPVSQQSGSEQMMSAEEALRWFETELRREPSNLQNKHANEETVIARIHTKLGKAEAYLERVDTVPEQPAYRFRNYLCSELFPVIDPIKPYPQADKLITLLQTKTNAVHG